MRIRDTEEAGADKYRNCDNCVTTLQDSESALRRTAQASSESKREREERGASGCYMIVW